MRVFGGKIAKTVKSGLKQGVKHSPEMLSLQPLEARSKPANRAVNAGLTHTHTHRHTHAHTQTQS